MPSKAIVISKKTADYRISVDNSIKEAVVGVAATAGGIVGTIFPVIGTALGSAAGALVGTVGSFFVHGETDPLHEVAKDILYASYASAYGPQLVSRGFSGTVVVSAAVDVSALRVSVSGILSSLASQLSGGDRSEVYDAIGTLHVRDYPLALSEYTPLINVSDNVNVSTNDSRLSGIAAIAAAGLFLAR